MMTNCALLENIRTFRSFHKLDIVVVTVSEDRRSFNTVEAISRRLSPERTPILLSILDYIYK